tara:strand:- start:110 stop:358 length:249 start_codon:yes stop_codon:yes gene_type:complete
MSNVSTDITITVKGQDLQIDIYADVDSDRVPDNIDLTWNSKDLPPRLKAYVEEHFEDEINEAICLAPLDFDDTAYDLSKECF